jgi:hypothetical protein
MEVTAAAVALLVAVGLRPNLLLYALPVLGFGLLWSRQPLRAWVRFGGIVAGGGLALLGPTVLLSGGWRRYATTTEALARWQSSTNSALSGSWWEAAENFEHLVLYLGDALNALLLLPLVFLPIALVRRRVAWFWPLFLGAWCLPPAVVYTVHHLPKAGYVLTILPGLFLAIAVSYGAAAGGLQRRAHRALTWPVAVWIAGVIALNTVAFTVAVPAAALDGNTDLIPNETAILLTGDYGRHGIQWRTEPQRRLRDEVNRLGGEDSALLFLWRTHQLQRIETVYHPDQWMLVSVLDHGCVHSNRDESFCGSFGDLQVRILKPPDGGLTGHLATSIDIVDNVLTLRRESRRVEQELEPVPSRLLLVFACPPCDVQIGAGLSLAEEVEITHRFRLLVLDVEGHEGAGMEN